MNDELFYAGYFLALLGVALVATGAAMRARRERELAERAAETAVRGASTAAEAALRAAKEVDLAAAFAEPDVIPYPFERAVGDTRPDDLADDQDDWPGHDEGNPIA